MQYNCYGCSNRHSSDTKADPNKHYIENNIKTNGQNLKQKKINLFIDGVQKIPKSAGQSKKKRGNKA